MASRRNRLGDARAYHPRGRTVRELPRPQDSEPPAAPPRPARPGRAPRTGAKPPRPARSAARPAARSTARPAVRKPAGKPARKPAAARRPPRLANPRRRLRLATVLVLAMFAVLGLRLVVLQFTDGPAYAASGREDRLQTVVLPAARGAIYDRNDRVLAHSVEAKLIFADPQLVSQPGRVAEALQPYLGVPASELLERMRPRMLPSGEPSRYERLARGVDIAVADEILALNLPGIGAHSDERRIVPGNDLAANVIGFTGTDQDSLVGLEGLEARFDEVLRGIDGERTFERGQGATQGLEIAGGFRSETPPRPGSDLHLTLDMDVQYEVQRVLAERLRAAGAEFGTAVLLDAHSGEVVALASYPGYNAADPQSVAAQGRVDVGTSVVFDPGSAHKPLVLGAALQEGVVDPNSSVVVDPSVQKGDQTFRDQIWHPPGTRMSLSAVLAFSSNVGTIGIADSLGSETLYAYQQAFGLGQPTGLGLPGEASGALLAPADWSGSSYGSVPIGHSVDVTALQLAAAYGVIANDGVWVQPRLVQGVEAPDGTEEPAAAPVTRRVLSPDVATSLQGLLEAVVAAPGGTGAAAAVDGYRVAGKTGTGALVVDGEYAEGNVASFVGMAPAEAPRYVLAVSAYQAGTEAVCLAFGEMMGFALQHYRVPPSTTEPPGFDLYPSETR